MSEQLNTSAPPVVDNGSPSTNPIVESTTTDAGNPVVPSEVPDVGPTPVPQVPSAAPTAIPDAALPPVPTATLDVVATPVAETTSTPALPDVAVPNPVPTASPDLVIPPVETNVVLAVTSTTSIPDAIVSPVAATVTPEVVLPPVPENTNPVPSTIPDVVVSPVAETTIPSTIEPTPVPETTSVPPPQVTVPPVGVPTTVGQEVSPTPVAESPPTNDAPPSNPSPTTQPPAPDAPGDGGIDNPPATSSNSPAKTVTDSTASGGSTFADDVNNKVVTESPGNVPVDGDPPSTASGSLVDEIPLAPGSSATVPTISEPATIDDGGTPWDNSNTGIIIGVICAIALLLFASAALSLYRRRRASRQRGEGQIESANTTFDVLAVKSMHRVDDAEAVDDYPPLEAIVVQNDPETRSSHRSAPTLSLSISNETLLPDTEFAEFFTPTNRPRSPKNMKSPTSETDDGLADGAEHRI